MGFLATPKARSASTPASRRPGGLPLRVLPHRTTGARGVRQAPRVWREESSPHLKPINKIPRLIRTATAVIVAGGLAVMVLSAQDDLDTVRQAAEQGLTEAQYNLGVMYDNGQGVPEDDAEAVKWFRLSAEQGNAEAQLGLGILYQQGWGVPEDYVLAYAWYNLASAQGNEQARDIKDDLRTRMTPDQIARAQVTKRDPFRPHQLALWLPQTLRLRAL